MECNTRLSWLQIVCSKLIAILNRTCHTIGGVLGRLFITPLNLIDALKGKGMPVLYAIQPVVYFADGSKIP